MRMSTIQTLTGSGASIQWQHRGQRARKPKHTANMEFNLECGQPNRLLGTTSHAAENGEGVPTPYSPRQTPETLIRTTSTANRRPVHPQTKGRPLIIQICTAWGGGKHVASIGSLQYLLGQILKSTGILFRIRTPYSPSRQAFQCGIIPTSRQTIKLVLTRGFHI